MYGNLPDTPSIGRRPKRHQSQIRTASDTATILTRSLNQRLRQGLYTGLFQGYAPPNEVTPVALKTTGTTTQVDRPTDVGGPSVTTRFATADIPTASSLSGPPIRQVALLTGESVSLAFTPEEGLVYNPTGKGQLLVLTDQRLMAFGQREGMRETVLMPVEEVKTVAVNVGARSKGTLLQGGLMVVAAVVFYVLIAYWLTGRIDGPTVPIIRMDLVAFIVFLAVLSGVGMMAQMYFGKPDGEAIFQGDGVKVTFPFRGESAEEDMFKLVNAAFAARRTMVAKVGVRISGAGSSGLNTD